MSDEFGPDDEAWDIPSPSERRYKVEGFAQTRDFIVWVTSMAPDLKYGLTLEGAFTALNDGFLSVHHLLKDAERIAQWKAAREKARRAYHLFRAGQIKDAKLTLQEAEELFGGLRRIGGERVSRQRLGETEHGANELDE
jgi:hypothetical protein